MAAAEEDIRTELRADGVMLVTLNRPPGNALNRSTRAGLIAALDGAGARGARAVVLASMGRNFSSSSAIEAVVEAADGSPSLSDLCQKIEDHPLPVVAALKGLVSGPGADLALAAHARVAGPDTRIGFPEIGLGLLPGGGATQRLPRLIGAAEALLMLMQARPMPVEEALVAGLVDVLAEGDPLEEAARFAASMPGPRPVRTRVEGLADFAANHAALASAEAEAKRGILPAPKRLVEAISAALVLPFENGLALEDTLREDLAESDESKGLIAAALAERRAAFLPPALAGLRPQVPMRLGLSGTSGQMAPLAAMALAQGLNVAWVEADQAARAANMRWIENWQAAEIQAGRLTSAQRDADAARMQFGATPDVLDGVELVIHAGAGDDQARLMRWLPALPHLVCGGGGGVMGLCLAPSLRLAEVALPAEVAPAHIGQAVILLRRLGLSTVLVGNMPILGRRIVTMGRRALLQLLEMGVPRRVIAAALDGFGHAMPDLPEPANPAPMRSMSEDEVRRRWLGAMANDGMRLLDARLAQRPSDIDLVMVAGFGFPRWRGGPMHQAGRRGLMVLRRDLREWSAGGAEDHALWAPHPLIDRMIEEGRRLADLDLSE